jgi:hypothetical protein
MGKMKSPHEFLLAYFGARTAQIEQELANRQLFRQKYFACECRWESRADVLEASNLEAIDSIEQTEDGGAVAITARGAMPKLRYTLIRVEGSWLIRKIQPSCANCQGIQAKSTCEICSGTGWLEVPDL